MKKLVPFLMMIMVIAMSSCSKYILVKDSSRCPKEYQVYKSKYTAKYVEKAYDQIQSQKMLEDKAPIANSDSNFVVNNYQLLWNMFNDYFIREYDQFNNKMGMGWFDWSKGFVKVAYMPWPEMPLASAEAARQFDLYMTACAKEWNKIKLGGSGQITVSQKIFSKAFMFPYLDATIQAWMEEYTIKTSNPMVKKK